MSKGRDKMQQLVDEVLDLGQHCAPWGKKPDPTAPTGWNDLAELRERMRQQARSELPNPVPPNPPLGLPIPPTYLPHPEHLYGPNRRSRTTEQIRSEIAGVEAHTAVVDDPHVQAQRWFNQRIRQDVEAALNPRPGARLCPGLNFVPENGGKALFIGGVADGQVIDVPAGAFVRTVAGMPRHAAYWLGDQPQMTVPSYPRSHYRSRAIRFDGAEPFIFMLEESLTLADGFRLLMRFYITHAARYSACDTSPPW